MRGPEFEKQVRAQMEEIKFAPSDAVWDGVEKELDRERRRRLPLFWWWLTGAAIVAALWWSGKSDVGSLEKSLQSEVRSEEKSLKREVGSEEKSLKLEVRSEKTKESLKWEVGGEEKRLKREVRSGELKDGSTLEASAATEPGGRSKLLQTELPVTSNFTPQTSNSEEPATSNLPPQTSNSEPVTSNLAPQTSNSEPVTSNLPPQTSNSEEPATSNLPPQTSNSKSPNPQLQATSYELQATSSKLIAKSTKPLAPSPRWRFGLTITPGGSQLQSGLFRKVQMGNSSGNQYLLFAAPLNAVKTSTLNPGFSFSAGLFASRALGSRLWLNAGLNYHYFSVSGTVYRPVYYMPLSSLSSVNAAAYSSNDGKSDYRSDYHFLEIPLSLEWRMTRARKFPLSVQGGLSYLHFLGGEPVIYNSAFNAIYKDNSEIVRNQFMADLGIMVGLGGARVRFEAGPVVQYGLTNVVRNQGGPQHLFFGGLRLTISKSK